MPFFGNWCSYSVIFRVGSTWLTLLPLQIWRTYNNQYPRPLEMLPSLQRCPEGIHFSFLLLCPSESANDQRQGKSCYGFPPDDDNPEFPPDDNNPKFLRLSFCGYTRRFTLPAFVDLLLTLWLVACTDQESGSHHVQEGCSPMVREKFIRHAKQSPTPGAQVRFC